MKFKKMLLIVTVSLFILSVTTTVNADEDIRIMCTNSVLSDFTSNLLKENNTNITYIMPSGVCPAYYDITIDDIEKITNADVLISFGNPMMEPWLANLLEHNQDCEIIECTNLGEWNLPTGAKKYVNHISEGLIEIFPGKNSTIQKNRVEYLLQINATSQILKQKIIDNNTLDTKIVSMGWQKDFLEYLGLNVTYYYGPPQGLSTKDELEIINAASEEDVAAIVDNLQSGTDLGARIASETGKSHVIFTNFPDAIPGTDTYLKMINYNTEQLLKAIKTYEYKKGEIQNLEKEIQNLELQRNLSISIAVIFLILMLMFFVFYKRK